MEAPSANPAPPRLTLARSRALREATLRSEGQRAIAVIAVLALVALLVLLPDSRRGLPPEVMISASIGIILLLALQLCVLTLAHRSRRRQRGLPNWFVISTVILETLIPTAMISSQFAGGKIPPYALLSAPPKMAYALLIVLTTLRLRPGLCLLSGSVSALGFASMLLYITYVMGIAEPTTGLPYAAYINSALMLFITGIAAAWVAREIRGHMEAALGEAEIKNQMARIEQDLAVARSIQQALLPHAAPTIPGFDIAGWNRSADQTGGDYFDWHALPGGHWIVTLADVSGHGIGPALVTAACRAYLRASSHYDSDLASLTTRINRLLADDLPDGRFVTMVSVLIDPRADQLCLLSAGHGPIVLCAAGGVVTDILPRDLPLAIAPDTTFGPPQLLALAAGDVLALVTDGFIEWARPGPDGRREEFGLPRLRESLRRHAHLQASALIEAVAADVAAFAQSEPQQDDLTMVIIRRVS